MQEKFILWLIPNAAKCTIGCLDGWSRRALQNQQSWYTAVSAILSCKVVDIGSFVCPHFALYLPMGLPLPLPVPCFQPGRFWIHHLFLRVMLASTALHESGVIHSFIFLCRKPKNALLLGVETVATCICSIWGSPGLLWLQWFKLPPQSAQVPRICFLTCRTKAPLTSWSFNLSTS